MSQVCYISYAGQGGEIEPQHREELESVIRALSTLVRWDEKLQCYCLDEGRWNTLEFTKQGLMLQFHMLDSAQKADLMKLMTTARTLGMTMFGDEATPDDEFTWQNVVDFLSPRQAPPETP